MRKLIGNFVFRLILVALLPIGLLFCLIYEDYN